MYYIIYKVVNKINGRYYIGKHVTKDPYDDYLGSGKLIALAVKKHGKESFTKEILFYVTDKKALNQKETEIVNEGIVHDRMSYNMVLGGGGGFTTEEAKKGRRAANKIGAHIKGGKSAIKNLTKEKRSQMGKKGGAVTGKMLHGVSKTGNVTWAIVRDIRAMYKSNIKRINIKKKYPILTQATVNDIIAHRTWK